MDIASHGITLLGGSGLVTPLVLVAAGVLWTLLATGAAGRVAVYLEELRYRTPTRERGLTTTARRPTRPDRR